MPADSRVEPYDEKYVKQLVRQIIVSGQIGLSQHAKERLAQHGMDMSDVENILRGGWARPGELESGSYRYRYVTHSMGVVIAFRGLDRLRIVTAWRGQR